MQVELVRTFRFEAAHSLPNVPEDHKCRRLHGHSYRIDVHVVGDVDPATGMLMDFERIKAAVGGVLERLDHRLLNEIPGLGSPTSEMLAKFLWEQVKVDLPELSAVTVWESDMSRCVYRGNASGDSSLRKTT